MTYLNDCLDLRDVKQCQWRCHWCHVTDNSIITKMMSCNTSTWLFEPSALHDTEIGTMMLALALATKMLGDISIRVPQPQECNSAIESAASIECHQVSIAILALAPEISHGTFKWLSGSQECNSAINNAPGTNMWHWQCLQLHHCIPEVHMIVYRCHMTSLVLLLA